MPECGYPIIESDLFDDLAAIKPQYGDTCEMYLLPGRCRQGARQEITKGRSCIRAAALSLSNHIVSVGQQGCCSPKVQIRKCIAKTAHEHLDILSTTARSMQRIPQEHFWRSSSSTAAGSKILPQKSVNHRPTTILFFDCRSLLASAYRERAASPIVVSNPIFIAFPRSIIRVIRASFRSSKASWRAWTRHSESSFQISRSLRAYDGT